MREFNNEELDKTAEEIMYEIVNVYIDFYNRRNFDKTVKITLYDEVELHLTWGMKKYINTRYYWISYEPNEDDLYLLNQIAIYFQPKTLLSIIKWYQKLAKQIS
jgi:hypothetical protein